MNLGRITEVFPRANCAWLIEIAYQAPPSGIDTKNETASFLAQFGHETAGFTRFEENMNYSADRLMAVWPSRFPDIASSAPYARNPEALAAKVYGTRMGNTEPGDGWRYRGRGPQVTGRYNYGKAGALVGLDLIAEPDLLLRPSVGVRVACAGWKAFGLDLHDDDADARAERRIVNGGTIGLKETQSLLDKLLEVLA